MISRKWILSGFLAYASAATLILLSPTADLPMSAVGLASEALRTLGLPSPVTTASRVEFILNAIIVAPLAAGGSLLFPLLSWRDWTAWAFVTAVGVEAFQGLVLPSRSATFVDVAANTTGALLGAFAVSSIRILRKVRATNAAQSAT